MLSPQLLRVSPKNKAIYPTKRTVLALKLPDKTQNILLLRRKCIFDSNFAPQVEINFNPLAHFYHSQHFYRSFEFEIPDVLFFTNFLMCFQPISAYAAICNEWNLQFYSAFHFIDYYFFCNFDFGSRNIKKIGRASCRERV